MVEVAGRLRRGELARPQSAGRNGQIEEPRIEPALGYLLGFDRAQRRDNTGVCLCLVGCDAFGATLPTIGQIARYDLLDRERASSLLDMPSQLTPLAIEERPRLILRLAEREDVDAIGDERVVGRSERLIMLLAVVAAEPRDPCAIPGRKTPVADEGSSIHPSPMRFAPDVALRTSRAGVKFGVPDRASHGRFSVYGDCTEKMYANAGGHARTKYRVFP